MLSILFATVISTLHLQGTATPGNGDYVVVPFTVPAGTVEFDVAHVNTTPSTILDFGVWAPEGFRGWGGGLTETTTVGVDESSRGYLIGPVTAGGWQVVIGKANLAAGPADYTLDFTFRDAATLTARARAPYAPTVLATGGRWYKGDLHCHSSESGDAMASFQQMVDLARSRHLDFIVVSDHNTVSQQSLIDAVQPSVPDLLLIRGIEVTTYGGHGGAMGASAYVDHRIGLDGRTAAQMIADVNAQGGAFIVNHPVLDLGNACIGCAWKHDDTPWMQVAALEIQTGNYLQFNALFATPTLALWDQQLDAGARLAAVGGSDDHRAGMDSGGAPSEIGTPTTLVWADELSEAAILAGVKGGHTMVALRGPDDPTVELTTRGKTPLKVGDTATGSHVALSVHVVGGSGMTLSLVQDGVELPGVPVDKDDWTQDFDVKVAAAGSRVRAHLGNDEGAVVVTSHLWLTYAAPSGCAVGGHASAGLFTLLFALALAAVLLRRRNS